MAADQIFVIQDDGTVRPLPLRLWCDLAHGSKGLPEYTLSAVRVVDVLVDNDRAPIIQKVGAGYHLNFGPDGQLRVGDDGVDTSGAPWIPTEFELEAIRASIHGESQDGVAPPNLGATLRGSDDTFSITYNQYEEPPCGKVVFNKKDEQFIIYADPQMHGPVVRKAVAKAFLSSKLFQTASMYSNLMRGSDDLRR
jgi:hypothetical protein